MRARMALTVSAKTCEIRELVLRDKPAHMLEISPKGTVPVLQTTDGTVIEESLDVMLWTLRQNDPLAWLDPEIADEATMVDLIQECEDGFKSHLDRYKYANRYEDANPAEHRAKAEIFVQNLNTRLEGSPYLFGTRPALADYAIAPFIRQFANTDRAWFDQTPYPHVHKWLAEFLGAEIFTSIMEKLPVWKPGDDITYRF